MRPLITSLLKLLVEIVSYLLQFKLRKHLLTFQEQAVEQALACRQNAYLSCHSGRSELRVMLIPNSTFIMICSKVPASEPTQTPGDNG